MGKEVVELSKGEAKVIEGEFVNVKQSRVRSVEGGHIELQQVGALSIDGDRVDVTQGAASVIHGNEMTINQSACILSSSNNTAMNFSFCPVSVTRNNSEVNKSAVGVMLAREIKTEGTSSLITIAQKVEGNINTLLDWRSALALGAVLGGMIGLAKLFIKK